VSVDPLTADEINSDDVTPRDITADNTSSLPAASGSSYSSKRLPNVDSLAV